MKKILIVEDDQFLVNAYQEKFSKIEDIKINIALDGNQGLESIRNDKPDAIILDLAIPNLDGFQLLKTLKDEDINIPILVASNLSSKNDIKRATDLGVTTYFIKSDCSIKKIIDKTIELAKK
jgi:DNA-binding response OmpR family regulator